MDACTRLHAPDSTQSCRRIYGCNARCENDGKFETVCPSTPPSRYCAFECFMRRFAMDFVRQPPLLISKCWNSRAFPSPFDIFPCHKNTTAAQFANSARSPSFLWQAAVAFIMYRTAKQPLGGLRDSFIDFAALAIVWHPFSAFFSGTAADMEAAVQQQCARHGRFPPVSGAGLPGAAPATLAASPLAAAPCAWMSLRCTMPAVLLLCPQASA